MGLTKDEREEEREGERGDIKNITGDTFSTLEVKTLLIRVHTKNHTGYQN